MEDKFLDFLKKKKQIKVSSLSDKDKELNEWIADIESFFSQVRLWLAEAEKQDLLQIRVDNRQLSENQLGEYTAPKLIIIFEDEKVEVVPIGKYSLNANGRINMASSKGLHTFLYFKDKGWFLLKPGHGYEKLNPNLFFSLLMELF